MEVRSMNRSIVFAAIVVAFLMVLMVLPVNAAVVMHDNYVDWGETNIRDFYATAGSTPADCLRACQDDPNCKLVEWQKPGRPNDGTNPYGRCWLASTNDKSSLVPKEDFTTWIITQEQSPPGGGSYGPAPGGQSCWGMAPNADFTATPLSGEKPLTVRFTAVVASGVSEGWTFSDSIGVNNEHNPTHVFSKAGTFTVDHMVSIPDSCGVDHIDRKTKTNYITVTEPVQPSKLYVSSTPSGASVYVDTVYQGTTPVTIPQLIPGLHIVRLTLTGYDEYSKQVTITAGETYPLSVQLTQSPSPSITVTGSSGTTGSGQSSGTTGSLQISTNPSGAAIILDGNNKGTTPATISGLTAGTHSVKLTMSGYYDFSQDSVTVAAGKTTPVNGVLVSRSQPAPSPVGSTPTPTPYQPGAGGSIIITTNPTGANVYLDGKTSGTAPVTLQNVDPGTHTVLLTMSGYTDASRTVDVAAGSQNQISVDLTRGKKTPGFETLTAVLSIAGLVAIRMLRRKEE